jgi:hypothetical protein
MDHFLYIIIPTEANFVKVGRWSGEVVKLKQRYTTYYGFFEMIVFQCYNSIVLEYEVLREMKLFCFKGELFHKECVDMFMKIMNRKMGKEVFIQNKILNLEFLRGKELKKLRRKNIELDSLEVKRKKMDLEKKIQKEKELKKLRRKNIELDSLEVKRKKMDLEKKIKKEKELKKIEMDSLEVKFVIDWIKNNLESKDVSRTSLKKICDTFKTGMRQGEKTTIKKYIEKEFNIECRNMKIGEKVFLGFENISFKKPVRKD